MLSLAQKIVNCDLYKDVSTLYQHENVTRFDLGDRYYLCATPVNPQKIYGLLVFYHGSRDIAWTNALEYTKLVNYAEEYNVIIIFGQASGKIKAPTIHPHYHDASFGEIYWEIREDKPQFVKDIEYTQNIIDNMLSKYKIDQERIYFLGHSNGGVFAMLLALHLPNTFQKIVSHMGGIGFDPRFYLDFSKVDGKRKTPVLFYTASHDIHLNPCKAGQQLLLGEGFPIVDLYVEDNIGHIYLDTCEKYILDWLIIVEPSKNDRNYIK